MIVQYRRLSREYVRAVLDRPALLAPAQAKQSTRANRASAGAGIPKDGHTWSRFSSSPTRLPRGCCSSKGSRPACCAPTPSSDTTSVAANMQAGTNEGGGQNTLLLDRRMGDDPVAYLLRGRRGVCGGGGSKYEGRRM